MVHDIAAGPDVLTRLAASESGTPVDPRSGCMTCGDVGQQGIRLSRIPENHAERPGERPLRRRALPAPPRPAAMTRGGRLRSRDPAAPVRMRSSVHSRRNCNCRSRDPLTREKTARYGQVRTEFFSGLGGGSTVSTLASNPARQGLEIEVFRCSRRVFFLHRFATTR